MITTSGKIRDTGGFDENIAIDDAQIVGLLPSIEKRVLRDCFKFHYKETPSGNPNTNDLWDGSNTGFTIASPIADKDFDESFTDDVTGTWLDSSMAKQDCTVVVTSERYGYVTITQDDDISAIPSNAKYVHVDYYTNDEEIPFDVLEDLGTLWACHIIQLRLTEPAKISYKDLRSNERLIMVSPTRFKTEYYELLRSYTEPLLMGN